jgi:hypothetical protein
MSVRRKIVRKKIVRKKLGRRVGHRLAVRI